MPKFHDYLKLTGFNDPADLVMAIEIKICIDGAALSRVAYGDSTLRDRNKSPFIDDINSNDSLSSRQTDNVGRRIEFALRNRPGQVDLEFSRCRPLAAFHGRLTHTTQHMITKCRKHTAMHITHGGQ